MLANELDHYKRKGNKYMDNNIQEIQEIYTDEEMKKEKGKVGTVILIKPYEVSTATSSFSQTSTINVTTTKAELFAIRCGINQAINIPNVEHIIIITDSIYATERIFDSLPHLYQTHSAAISKELWKFFRVSINNHIDF